MVFAEASGILVVGGYGVVGRRIAARLAPMFPGQVIIAGRDEARAQAQAAALGHSARARRVDVEDPASIDAALGGVGAVMVCVAQRELHLLRASIARGLAYTDIAPRLAFWEGADEMHERARRTGARVLLGAGLSPGISNMMAARLAARLRCVDRIETAIALSIGDEYGPDSLTHVLEAIGRPLRVFERGRVREALPFSEGRRIAFPAPLGPTTAYLFPWSDVVNYPKTLGVETAVGRFALDPPWLGRLASLFVRAGAARRLEKSALLRGHRHALERIAGRYEGRDNFALVVTAEAHGRTMAMSLAGRRQADATASGAAELVRHLVESKDVPPGVWLPEQVVSHESFFERLAARGWTPTFDESTTAAQREALPIRRRAHEARRGSSRAE